MPGSAFSEPLAAARCPSCRSLIDLESSRVIQPRPQSVAVPERWQVDARPGSLQVKWRWFSVVAFFLVPFTLFWNGIMTTMAVGFTEGFTHPERLFFGLLIPHVWVGIGLAYYCVALFVNSTTVKVGGGTLHVSHGPLPWRGTKTIPVRDLAQLFVVEKRGNRGSLSYELCGLMRDGKRQSILTGLTDETSARFLEVRLEQVMNIVDHAVAGELKR